MADDDGQQHASGLGMPDDPTRQWSASGETGWPGTSPAQPWQSTLAAQDGDVSAQSSEPNVSDGAADVPVSTDNSSLGEQFATQSNDSGAPATGSSPYGAQAQRDLDATNADVRSDGQPTQTGSNVPYSNAAAPDHWDGLQFGQAPQGQAEPPQHGQWAPAQPHEHGANAQGSGYSTGPQQYGQAPTQPNAQLSNPSTPNYLNDQQQYGSYDPRQGQGYAAQTSYEAAPQKPYGYAPQGNAQQYGFAPQGQFGFQPHGGQPWSNGQSAAPRVGAFQMKNPDGSLRAGRIGLLIALVAQFLVLLGCLGPWASLFGTSMSGMQADGVIVFVLTLVGIGLSVVRLLGKVPAKLLWGVVALATLSLITAFMNFVDISGLLSVGWGLLFVIFFSFVAAGAAAWAARHD